MKRDPAHLFVGPAGPLSGDPVPPLTDAGRGDPPRRAARGPGAPPTGTAGGGARLADERSIGLIQPSLDCILSGAGRGKWVKE